MKNNQKYNREFEEIRANLFDLINYIDIKIDVSYILEELEEISYKVAKIDVNKIGLADQIRQTYNNLYKKYQNKLASFLSDKESRVITKKIQEWIYLLPKLY
ncbi:MAG: hypothetical protein ACTSYD_11040 [Candidatus Heimdallarchaeaceae archaeon]